MAALVINEEKAALQQRNIILNIADRHAWDTLREYLDDPLAEGTEGAAKLYYAMGLAARKRAYIRSLLTTVPTLPTSDTSGVPKTVKKVKFSICLIFMIV